jgi:hypothetical protein
MKTTLEVDRLVYELARDYLPSLKIPGVTRELIEKYLNPLSLHAKPASKEELYYRLLESAQEAGMKAGVIGGSIDGVKNLACVLNNFNPDAVLAKYGDNWKGILDQIEKVLKPRGQIRKREQSIWPRYCHTIISSARFLEQFESASDFYNWADFFDKDERARASLPMLMDREIDGLGFALSCNFLKELGYVNFPKPDVHLRDIFTALELCQKGDDDYKLFKAIIRVAGNANVTPYNVDKTFWLIGSGYFYDDPAIGSNGRIGRRHKQDFIDFARSKILLGQ